MMSFSTLRTLRLLCPSLARAPTLFGSVSVFSALVAVTLKCVNFHRSRCTDGFLGVQHRFNFSNKISPAVALGGTQLKVFPLSFLAHSSNDKTNFERVADRFTALCFIDHDLSLEGGDGVEEVSFERRAQNLCQLPGYTRFASRLVLVDQRSPSLESFTLFLVKTTFSALPLQKRSSARWKSAATLFSLSTCPVLKFRIQLSHSGIVSRSGFHCTDDFLYSSPLEPVSPGTEHPGSVSPRSVLAAEHTWSTPRSKRSKSESPVISSWCLWHLGPAGPSTTSCECICCHSRLRSVQSVPPSSDQRSCGLPGVVSLVRQLLRSAAFVRSFPSLAGSKLQLVPPRKFSG